MSDSFSRFLPGLRSSNSSVRHRAAQSLRLYIESESRDLSHGLYMKWVTDISARLMLLCNSNENADRMGGIAAMDELVELFIAERNDQTIIEFAHSLTKVFEKIPSAEPPTLRLAAKALGHIVSTGGTSLIEFVEDYHVKPALEWLKNETFHVRRHAAVMILKELSINAPSTSFRYMDKYFDFIWSAFWDSKLVVRVSASESLQSCFMLIQQRESNRKTSWYNRALDEAEGAFKRNSSEATHGALLILNELLRNTGDFMHSHYGRACRLVFSHQDHKSATVRSAVISLFPRLAKFNTSVFVEKCYRQCMNHLLEVLFSATTTTRPDALLSIGKLSLAIGPLLARDEQALMAIMNGIKGGLQVRKKDFDTHREALACLRMLAETVGPALIRVDLESMVGPLFVNDLDSSLVETLTTIVKKIPPMKPIIQQKLFERLSSILRSRQNDASGSASAPPSRRLKTTTISVTGLSNLFLSATGAKTNGSSENNSVSAEMSSAIAMQALALETLANFDFQGNRLIPIMAFVHETVVKFLDHEVATIRKSAALTCCKLLLPQGEDRGGSTQMTSEDFARPVTSVLERLLTVGIADAEASIRLRVLASLDSRFDPLLALNDNLRCLFIALNDEVFSIRQTAMSTLGRLTHHNPATVLPSLRQTLVQLLAELEFSGDSRGKEEGALLIGCLLRSASQLAQPYVFPILRVLMKNLREDSERRSHSRSTVSVSKAILATLGDLAEVGAQELTPYLSQLLPDVIDEMRDSSNPQILQVAIKTLGQLVSSTGYVVLPYHEYPELLDLLCQALQKSGDPFESLRIEAGRTIGVLGALDPYNLRLFHLQKQGKLTDAKKKEFRSNAFAVGAGGVFSLMTTGAKNAPGMLANGFGGIRAETVVGIRIGNGIGGLGMLDGSSEEDAQQLGESLLLNPARKVAKNDKQTSGKLTNIILEVPPDDLLPSMIPDSTQYFPTVAINALIRILLEPRNSVHYQGTFMAIMYICKSQRKRMGQHLDKIVPAFLYALEKVNRSLRKFLFEQLCDLVQIVEEQIQPHLDHVALLSIVNGYWDEHLEEVLNLVKKLANSLGESFRVYLPDLVPQMLRVIRTERDNTSRPRTLLVLKTAVSLGRLLDGYLHLIIPALVGLIQSDADINARKQGLGSLGSLVKKLNVSVYASKIIHMLARVISSQPELVYLAMDCLCCMVYTMGDDYAIFVPVISQVLGRHTSRTNDIFDRYDLLVSKILKYQPLPVASWATDPLKSRADNSSEQKDSGSSGQEETKSLPCDQKNLMKAWEASQRSTKEDWNEWILAFSVELLRESPSPVLRACKELASVYQPLARELFNASFVSVWPHLVPPTQDNLIRALEAAFQSPQLPSEILQTLLNLAEFMEHDDQPLPIDIRLLGSLADKCHSFAKALHYKELEFNTNPSTDGIQALISINSKLNQPEAARGILKYALEKLPGIEVKASWHEKLLRWDDALATHDRVLLEDPNNVESIFGKMRCLWATGEWRKLNDHVKETWSKIYGEGQDLNSEQVDGEKLLDVPPALKKELCSSGARVAFSLQNWDAIPKFINSDMDATESHLFQAVVLIRRMELDEAMNSIADCRKEMDPTLRSLVSESYGRAYLPAIVNLQMLTELEEIVAYLKTFAHKNNGELTLLSTPTPSMTAMSTTTSRRKQSISSLNFVSSSSSTSYGHEKQVALKKLQTFWTRRMLGVERNIEVWQSLMLVRSLVFDPREDVDIWLKYARLCLKSGHINLAASALWRVGAQPFIRSVERDPYVPIPINLGGNAGASQGFANGLLSLADSAAQDPRVAFSYLRHLWAENREDVALKQMDYFIEALEQHGDPTNEDLRKLRVQVYIQLGEWQMSRAEPHKQSEGAFDHVLECLETATKLDPTNDRAWHEWALMNFRALEATVKESGQSDPKKRYAVQAIQGFFRSISFGHTSYDVTKDVLRLLTLWFTHGNRSDVHLAMIEGFQEASVDTWLDVIPQLIARIDTPNPKTSELLQELLTRIGQAHPQALIYPITVASKALNPTRKLAAEGILAAVRRHSSQLVYEADMVSRELIRVAILWNELWHGALEEASKHFFNNRDVAAMIAELAPLHDLMEQIGTEESPTLREVAFYQAFARDLRYAKEWTDVYERTKSLDDLNQAWDIYYSVFSKIRKQLANLSTLELANVGPKLLSVNNLTLAVPGTYKAGAPIVRIQSFDTKVTVLTSKQRPRKVSINGSDGKAYPFLLKGHEDLRQDERVMQLFGVINTLLANDSDTSKRNLAIQRYSVLPLSHTSGLIGWVPNCDTIHQLIRDYREARKIQLNVEHRLMVQMAPDYDKLPLMQKVEAFKYALGETTGQDLYRVLWLKSQDSEVWLDRRRNYTRSLAVMSMAGYILGLGDRHPSNLMLDRVSGKMVHIDFGDCFEVAMERDKYPEKIPFRLTRMLTQAMEVSGIEGNFRYTCEASMRVLRDNRDSLMAVLEAFVYDPLINWRLLKKDTVPSHAQPDDGAGDAGDTAGDRSSVHGGRAGSDATGDVDGDAVNGDAAEDEKLAVGSMKSSASSAAVTPRRRRHSLSELGYNMDTMMAEASHEKYGYDAANYGGTSFVATEHPQLNEKALSVVERVKKKLAGRDFDDGSKVLTVDAQVDRLIHQATSHENLCQLYYGWCPFW
ncbi:phosphatidylinositol kinase- protein kinase tor1 [Phytophthora boehmeriae]|uniref:Serine/threonine-protein kinase TOR n=1 Tax=Phytophthora boehmeriae TaxID=109152 RepID=A0A8T1X6T3_9STRA|nr:phosphatidylinositol kinase- protein kinase tor1 [Phytophthora boehmeriae]